ncbi:MAG TPA: GTPase, partial [Dongiaceae bacterium]
MRLRTFTAPTISEAMRQVRTALGDDAVILSTEHNGKAVKVTAAIEPAAAAAATAPTAPDSADDLDSA